MLINELTEKWSAKYKRSINCNHPKGFSQRAHCQGRKKNESVDQEAGIGIDGLTFKFKVRDLIALAEKYPVTKIDPKQFEEQLASREEDPAQSMARAQKAELKYPIIVVKRKNGELWIADGTHRAHKAIMMNLPSINAKIIPVDDMGQFLVNETIRKVKDGYRLVSGKGKNLGTYPTRAGAEKRERQVQYFKHISEDISAFVSITQDNDNGSLEGYVVDTTMPQIRNYLESQGANESLINKLIANFGRIGVLRNLWVDDDYRNQGIGTELVNNAIRKAFSHEAEAIILVADTSEDNSQLGKSLEDWYKNWGFKTIGHAGNDPIMLLKNKTIKNEDANLDLAQALTKTQATSYEAIDKLMQKIAKDNGITAKELHDRWVKKYGETPDDWIKAKLNEDQAKGKFISPPGNTVGLNVFELSPHDRQRLNGTVVYHQTKKIDKILQSGGLRPRADVSGENSFAINDMQAGKNWRTPKGIFVSTTAKNWFGDEIAFKIDTKDTIYRAYHPEQGHLLIANPVPVDRFLSVNDKPLNEGPVWDKIKKTAAAGAVAGAAGYGALTGQLTGKDQPAKAPLEITIPGGDIQQQKPEVKKEKVKVELEPSTATNANQEMEQLVFLTAFRAGLRGKELAQFMAQAAHETLGFQRMAEVGNKEYFKRYDPTVNPAKAKILGNTKKGDGIKYRGRGFIQLTGRDNYRRAGEALGLPLEEKPQLASHPEVAAKVAVWFWKNRVRGEVKDFSDTIGVTAKINPSMNGLGDRDMNYQHYLQRLDL